MLSFRVPYTPSSPLQGSTVLGMDSDTLLTYSPHTQSSHMSRSAFQFQGLGAITYIQWSNTVLTYAVFCFQTPIIMYFPSLPPRPGSFGLREPFLS